MGVEVIFNEINGRNVERGKTMFRRILVPLDGSELSERALPVAARLAQASGGTITLLRVVTSPLEFTLQTTELSPSMQEALDADRAEATDYLARIAASPVLAGVATTTEVFKGTPAGIIFSVARSRQIDIIIMCSHGYTGMTRWALGSVAEKVAFYAPAPVLVLRKDGPVPASPHPDAARPLRTLVALDGSTRAEKGIEPAVYLTAALAAPAQGALHLTQVVKPVTADSEVRNMGEGDESQEIKRMAEGYLGSLANRLREARMVPAVADLKLPVTWSVTVDADVASALIRVADNGENAEIAGAPDGYDIIAMTTHGYGGIQRWAVGSITARVLKASRLPLLIVRPLDMMEKSNLTWDNETLSAI
jgi:nucleotide-binding universal stress UspA family protein